MRPDQRSDHVKRFDVATLKYKRSTSSLSAPLGTADRAPASAQQGPSTSVAGTSTGVDDSLDDPAGKMPSLRLITRLGQH